MSEDESFYSNDEQYFMDLCRGNQLEELQQFIAQLPETTQFNWGWFNNKGDNFMHMIAANNLPNIFDFLMPVVVKRCPKEQVLEILNRQNSSKSTPLHYAVITDSKQMVGRLLEAGADPQLTNQYNRNPFQQAEKFQKYQIAEILAPVTKTDLEALKKQIGDVKLDDSSDEEDQQQKLPIIEEKAQDKTQNNQENKQQKEAKIQKKSSEKVSEANQKVSQTNK